MKDWILLSIDVWLHGNTEDGVIDFEVSAITGEDIPMAVFDHMDNVCERTEDLRIFKGLKAENYYRLLVEMEYEPEHYPDYTGWYISKLVGAVRMPVPPAKFGVAERLNEALEACKAFYDDVDSEDARSGLRRILFQNGVIECDREHGNEKPPF